MPVEFFNKKHPDEIIFKRNNDGTYMVVYKGMVGVDDNNEVITDFTINLKRCYLKWDESGFLPTPQIQEILKDDANAELFHIVIPEEDKDIN